LEFGKTDTLAAGKLHAAHSCCLLLRMTARRPVQWLCAICCII